jgi:hypothetical protein
VIVNPVGQELHLGAADPISSVTVLDSQCLVKPSFFLKNADKLLQDIRRLILIRIYERYVTGFHNTPCFFDRKGSGIQGFRIQSFKPVS